MGALRWQHCVELRATERKQLDETLTLAVVI